MLGLTYETKLHLEIQAKASSEELESLSTKALAQFELTKAVLSRNPYPSTDLDSLLADIDDKVRNSNHVMAVGLIFWFRSLHLKLRSQERQPCRNNQSHTTHKLYYCRS